MSGEQDSPGLPFWPGRAFRPSVHRAHYRIITFCELFRVYAREIRGEASPPVATWVYKLQLSVPGEKSLWFDPLPPAKSCMRGALGLCPPASKSRCAGPQPSDKDCPANSPLRRSSVWRVSCCSCWQQAHSSRSICSTPQAVQQRLAETQPDASYCPCWSRWASSSG